MGTDDGVAGTGIISINSKLPAKHFGVADELTVAFSRNLSAGPKPFLRDQPHVRGYAKRARCRARQSLESRPALCR